MKREREKCESYCEDDDFTPSLYGQKNDLSFFSLLTFTHLQPPADSIIVVCGLFLHTCQILTALPK